MFSSVDTLLSQLSDSSSRQAAAERARYAPSAPFTNWGGGAGTCRPHTHHRPTCIEDVCRIVKMAVRERGAKPRVQGGGIRAVGAGYSPSKAAFTNGHMVHTHLLNRVLSVDREALLVRCEAGCSLRELCAALDAHECMMPTIPSTLDISVGGALATGVHSTGINVKQIGGYLVAATLVNGLGEVVRASAVTGENAGLLPALGCHLGVLGILVDVTLRVERKELFKMVSQPISVARLMDVVAQRVTMTEFYRVWWVPHTEMCFESLAHRLGPADEGKMSTVAPASMISAVPTGAPSVTGAAAAHRKLGQMLTVMRPLKSPDAGYTEWQQEQQHWTTRVDKAVRGEWLSNTVTEGALCVATKVPAIQPAINAAYRRVFLNRTEVKFGTRAFVSVMPGTFLRQHATEWAVSAAKCLEVLEVVRGLISHHKLRVHMIVEFRFVDADDCWMSPCYQRKSVMIGPVQYRPFGQEAPDTERYYALFAAAMTKLGGRPHWGKYNGQWADRDVRQAFPMWPQFLALQKQLDPHGVFVNDWFASLTTQS